jgi:hypothetical protein
MSHATTPRNQYPRRYRKLRGDVIVARAERIIEKLLGLPRGSVSIRTPRGTAAPRNKTVRDLRADYARFGR